MFHVELDAYYQKISDANDPLFRPISDILNEDDNWNTAFE